MSQKLTYAEQLKHPEWQRKRLEILQRDNFVCQKCFEPDKTLHVHHKHYRKGAKVWEYEDHVLVSLCEACHESAHVDHSLLNDVVAYMPMDGNRCMTECLSLLAGFIKGWAPDLDISGYMTLDATAALMGQSVSRIMELQGFNERAAKEFHLRLHRMSDVEVARWIAKLDEIEKN